MARSAQTDSAVVDTRPVVARGCALAATTAPPSNSHPRHASSVRLAAIGPSLLRSSSHTGADPSIRTPHRDRKRERRPGPHLALDPDLPAVQFDESPRQGEAEPGALLLRRADADLTELFEHGLLVLRRD